MLVDQVCEAAGGPCTYTGRDMRETHDGMAVTAGEFDALVEDLVATLGEFDVPKAEQENRSARSGGCEARSSRSSRRRQGRLCLKPTTLRPL
jgi:truncated hemoglobin YjbI